MSFSGVLPAGLFYKPCNSSEASVALLCRPAINAGTRQVKTLWFFVTSRQFSTSVHIYSSMPGKTKCERVLRIHSLSSY